MKVGCGEWGFRELPMGKHFEIARDLGFRTLGFGIGGDFPGRLLERMSDSDIAEYRELSARYQIRTPFACLENDFTLKDAAAHASMLSRTLDQILLARNLGATHIRLFAGFKPAVEMTEEIRTVTASTIPALESFVSVPMASGICGQLKFSTLQTDSRSPRLVTTCTSSKA